MVSPFKSTIPIKIRTVIIITIIQSGIFFFSLFLSLGDSSEPHHKYPIDIYLEVFGFPLAHLFRTNSLLLVGIDWILYAIAIERIIAFVNSCDKTRK